MLKISVINPDTNECKELKFVSEERVNKINGAIEIKILEDFNAMIKQIAEKILEAIKLSKICFKEIHRRLITKPKSRNLEEIVQILSEALSEDTLKNNLYSAS